MTYSVLGQKCGPQREMLVVNNRLEELQVLLETCPQDALDGKILAIYRGCGRFLRVVGNHRGHFPGMDDSETRKMCKQ